MTRQHTSNSSLYYLDESPTETTEDNQLTLKKDNFNMEFNHTINADTHYGSLTLSADAAQSDGLSQLVATSGTTSQRIRNPEVNLKDNVQQHYNKGKGQLNWNSIADYHHSQDALYLDQGKQEYSNNLWHTNHSLGYNVSAGHWNYSLSGNVEVEDLNVAHVDNVNLNMGLQPRLRYNSDIWKFFVSIPVTLSRFTHQQQTLLLPSPSLYVSHDLDNRRSWRATLGYHEEAGGWKFYALDTLQTDYRTYTNGADFVPRNRSLSSTFSYEYKRAIYHFFANFDLMAARTWNNAVSDMQVVDGNYYYAYKKHNTQSDYVNGSAVVSKGFFKAHLKTSLTLSGT